MLTPPFCPNRFCRHHITPLQPDWYILRGTYSTAAFGTVQRFSCKTCNKRFSEQTFRLDYYVKKPRSYLKVLQWRVGGCGIRDVGRYLGFSHQAVINRIYRLARQALAIHATLTASLHLREDLAADGFESFVGSQYHPNNIHLLVGCDSQMLYTFDYAHLRRKGRMRPDQRTRRAQIERSLMHNRRSVYRSFSNLAEELHRLLTTTERSETVLHSDEKGEYPRVLKHHPELQEMLESGRLTHKRTSSLLPRTGSNPLFPVNYMDRQLRKDNANHVRETVEYSRNTNNCMAQMAIYQLQHNCRKPYRVGLPGLEELRHAEVAGVSRERIEEELASVFELRRFVSRVELSYSQVLVWFRMVGMPDRWDGGYFPHYVWM
jgi:transposase-like protein